MIIKKVINGKPTDEPVEDEIIAVITAAVKAAIGGGTYNLNVRPFRRVGAPTPIWSMVSRKDQIDSRRMI